MLKKINAWQTSLRKQNLSHLHQICDIILSILLFLFSHYQPLYWQYNIYQATSLQSQYTFTKLLSKVFLYKYNKNIFLRLYMKYYDKMHYEEEFDLFCSCIRANINIMLYKTTYEK